MRTPKTPTEAIECTKLHPREHAAFAGPVDHVDVAVAPVRPRHRPGVLDDPVLARQVVPHQHRRVVDVVAAVAVVHVHHAVAGVHLLGGSKQREEGAQN